MLQVYQLLTTNHQPPTTNHQTPNPNHQTPNPNQLKNPFTQIRPQLRRDLTLDQRIS